MVDQSKFQPKLGEKEVEGVVDVWWVDAGSQTLEEGSQSSPWIP